MTKNIRRFGAILASLVFAFTLVAGCSGGGSETEQAADKAADATVVAVHDCDGDCGMTDVPVDQMTVTDGKYYCAGCAKKAEGTEHPAKDHPASDDK